jgi:hypothetical protein
MQGAYCAILRTAAEVAIMSGVSVVGFWKCFGKVLWSVLRAFQDSEDISRMPYTIRLVMRCLIGADL